MAGPNGRSILTPSQIGNLGPHFPEVACRKLTHLGARPSPAFGGKREQGTDFIKREPEFARTAEPSQPLG